MMPPTSRRRAAIKIQRRTPNGVLIIRAHCVIGRFRDGALQLERKCRARQDNSVAPLKHSEKQARLPEARPFAVRTGQPLITRTVNDFSIDCSFLALITLKSP